MVNHRLFSFSGFLNSQYHLIINIHAFFKTRILFNLFKYLKIMNCNGCRIHKMSKISSILKSLLDMLESYIWSQWYKQLAIYCSQQYWTSFGLINLITWHIPLELLDTIIFFQHFTSSFNASNFFFHLLTRLGRWSLSNLIQI